MELLRGAEFLYKFYFIAFQTLHFKRSLKQKENLTYTFSWGLGQIWNQTKYFVTKQQL